jgi:SAM-dependent methyltransferase
MMELFVVGIGLCVNEWYAHHSRQKLRKSLFTAARNHANRIAKPLLVIGRPDGWDKDRLVRKGDTVWWREGAHPCGDYTVDVRPKGSLECPNYVETSAEDLSMFPDNFFGAVFSSCTLEHVPDLPRAWKEINRVVHPKGVIYVIRPQPWSMFAWLFPAHNWVILRGTNDPTFLNIGKNNEVGV